MSVLPPVTPFSYNWADWEAFLEVQYKIFTRDILQSRLLFKGKPVSVNFTLSEGKEETFWHITTRNIFKDGKRDPDPPRAERVHWIRPIIENFTASEIRYWAYIEGSGKTRHYFQVMSCNYLLILEEKKTSHFLVTAYLVDKRDMLADLDRKYKNQIKDA